jgi:hypothetical protein
MITSTRKPQGRHIAVIKQHVVLANVTDTTDGDHPERVWWSATGDETDFDPDVDTGSGFEDLDTQDGPIQAITGGEVGFIIQERAITRMSFEGRPTLFRFDKVVFNRGTIAPGSVVGFNRVIFFIDRDGFYLFDGTNVQPIGKQKVDRFFTADLDSGELDAITTTVEPENSLVCWGYQSENASNGIPDRIITYNWTQGNWGVSDVEHQIIFNDRSNAVTVDGTVIGSDTIDSHAETIDADQWKGGTPLIAGFSDANKLARFSGAALTATFTTPEFTADKRIFINKVRPIIDGTTAVPTIEVGTRELPTDAVSFTSAESLTTDGTANVRKSGRYMRIRTKISGGFDEALAVQFDPKAGGKR